MSRPLTERTKRLISQLVDSALQARLLELFENDGALYGPATDEVLERVRFAVIKLAIEGEPMLDLAMQLSRSDARDLLVNAEFADDLHAHERWCETMLQVGDVETGA